MKRYNSINEIVEYILNKHSDIKDVRKSGVHALMMLRKSDGKRIIFGELKGFRIFDWQVHDNAISIDAMAVGLSMRGNKKIQQHSRLILHPSLINVYEYRAEFLSESSIDFTYSIKNYAAELQHTREWIRDKSAPPLARWVVRNNDTEELLESLSCGERIYEVGCLGRDVEMDFEDF